MKFDRFSPNFSIRQTRRRNRLSCEALEQRNLLAADPVISELMAANASTLQDEDGDYSDWIEISNAGDESVDLGGYWLTDANNDLTGWRFPSVELGAGEAIVVFASGKDRDQPEGELHTNFRLDADGDYLALVGQDGSSIIQEFAPQYPPQVPDVSYGVAPEVNFVELVSNSSEVAYSVPTDATNEATWATAEFDDSNWSRGAMGIGYETFATEDDPVVASILGLDPLGYWRFEETNGSSINTWGSDAGLSGTTEGNARLNVTGPEGFGFEQPHSAIRFDGRNDAVTTNASALSDLSAFTLMGFIAPDEQTEQRVGLFGQDDAIEFGFISPNQLHVWTPTGGSVNASYEFANDEWHHVAAVGDGTQIRIYIDGNLAASGGTATANYGASAAGFNIGGEGIFDATANWFDGEMDEVAIFDKALTAEQIQSVVAGTGNNPNEANLSSLIATDIETAMLNQNSSFYLRTEFDVPDPSRLAELKLNLNFDDGFVAFINGLEVARANAPGDEEDPVPYNAAATMTGSDVEALRGETIDISDSRDALTVGRNVLAVQVLNAAVDDPDVVFGAGLSGAIASVDSTIRGYLTTPSPGDANNPVTTSLGPLVGDIEHSPNNPTTDQSIVVTAEVTKTLFDVAGVELRYRVMFGAETTISMVDDGTGADSTANDGIYTATIPGNIAQPGDMVRWYVEASDLTATTGRWPRFEVTSGRDRLPEYEGTLIVDPSIDSQLGVLHWWVEDETAAGTRGGTHASLSYNGEFYDSVFVRQRGGSTAGNSLGKTNFKFDFVQEQFRFQEDLPRVEEFNLNTTATDKAYIRQPMSFDAYAALGTPSSISFPMNIQRNGEFYGVFAFIEEPDDEMLERNNLDDDGALYKIFNEFTSASNVRKKTREDENNSDLSTFISRVRTLDGEELRNYLVDNVNLPATLNYLVGTVLIHQNDNPHKNHFLYRDTEGTGEWMFLPWDNDLTWGSNWVGTSFSDIIYADDDVITEGPVPGHNPAFIHPSHPFVNSEPYREWNNHWNRLMDAILQDPVLQQMYLRRLRSGMDLLLGEPGTRDSYFDQQLDSYLNLMGPDAAADREVWWQRGWGTPQTFEEAVEIIRTEYLEVRRQHLYVNHSVDRLAQDEITVLVPEGSQATYFVPGNGDLGQTWTAVDFDDSSWGNGPLGFGFENTPRNFTDLIQTRVKPLESFDDATSMYIRVPFQVDDPSAIENLSLRMRYDDGFVAYLNGQKILEQNLSEPGEHLWNSTARTHSNTQAQEFENFDIGQHIGLLQTGQNVLAIHGMNTSLQSSDMLFSPELIDGVVTNVDVAGIPHGQTDNPPLTIDQDDYDVSPVSGNQDEEYFKINNPTDDYVDISGWRIEGGVRHTFAPGTIIPAQTSLYVSPNVAAFRNRASGPTGGQGLFVQGAYNGHISSFGETMTLVAADGQVMSSLTTPSVPSTTQQYLRVTEVNYNPVGLDDTTEFIEITNTNPDGALDLTNVTLSQGPQEPFVLPAGTTLAPLQSLVVAKDVDAFRAMYPDVPANLALGPYVGNLSNQGERIKLDDALGNTIVDFSYSDNQLWAQAADGYGSTLELIQVGTATDQLSKYDQWQASRPLGGTPAAANSTPVGVLINEVVSNPGPGEQPQVELYNASNSTIDLTGWWLSDDPDQLNKYQIPAGTTIASEGYWSSTAAQLGFDLPATEDGELWLTSASEYADHFAFDAIAVGESWGRIPNGAGRPTTLTTSTVGATNNAPRVGPIVISEVNYNPTEPTAAALAIYSELDANDLEFVEVTNPTPTTTVMSDWRLRGGIDYNFDSGVTLGPNESLLVLRFDPDNPDNALRLQAFREHYGLTSETKIVGGYGGGLNDSFDRVTLKHPALTGQSLLEDEVIYNDVSPWPTSADGQGHSLQRVSNASYGNAAASWTAATPSPGTAFGDIRGDFDGDGVANIADIDLLFDQMGAAVPDLRFDLTGDNAVDELDRDEMVKNIVRIPYGDANGDGSFDSRDLVDIFVAGEYEDAIADNSGWSEGDWDGDGEFTTADLVLALQEGSYEA